MSFHDVLSRARVLPVLKIKRAENAVPLARALAAGGLKVLEVTLRTEAAIDAIRRIAAEVPEVTVGAGTVTRARELEPIREAGGRFAVCPGLVPELARAALAADLPLLPGVMTPSEALAARDLGFNILKLFPAARPRVLSHRRHRRVELPGLPGAAQRRLRRRLVGGAGDVGRRGGLGPNHRAHPGRFLMTGKRPRFDVTVVGATGDSTLTTSGPAPRRRRS